MQEQQQISKTELVQADEWIELSLHQQFDSLQKKHQESCTFAFSDSTIFRKPLEKNDSVSYIPSVLTPHQLEVKSFTYNNIPKTRNDGNFIILGIILFLIAVACFINRKVYCNYLKAVFNSRIFALVNRDGSIARQNLFLPLIIVSHLSFALLTLFACQVFFPLLIPKFGENFILTIILIAIPILFTIYGLINKYLSYVFSRKKETMERFQYYFLSVFLGAQIVAPLLLLYAINPSKYLIWIALFVIGVLFIIRHVKCFILTSSTIFNLKYFLYLCTVEILPCLLIIKWASLF